MVYYYDSPTTPGTASIAEAAALLLLYRLCIQTTLYILCVLSNMQ